MTADYMSEKQDEVRRLAQRIEDELFRKASSKEEYYSSLAAKIFKLNQASTSNPASGTSSKDMTDSTLTLTSVGSQLLQQSQLGVCVAVAVLSSHFFLSGPCCHGTHPACCCSPIQSGHVPWIGFVCVCVCEF
jgi:hypothetical protein